MSAEVNYGIRFQRKEEAETFLKKLAVEVENRLNAVKMKGKAITLKLMVWFSSLRLRLVFPILFDEII